MSIVKCQKFYSLLIVLLLFFSSCDKEPPITEEKLIKVYVDLLIIQDTTTAKNFSLDSVKALVFKSYDVTAEQYDATLNYYNSRPEKWSDFFDRATAYAEGLKKEVSH